MKEEGERGETSFGCEWKRKMERGIQEGEVMTLGVMILRGRIREVYVVLEGCGTEVKLPNSQFFLGLVLSLTHFYYLSWQVM